MGTDDIVADALTEGVDAAAIPKHLVGVGIELGSDRHRIAPVLDEKAGPEVKLEDE